jgi:DNA topoisomerase I
VTLTAETLFPVAAVPGLTRSDPHGPGITRERADGGFRYFDPSGAQIISEESLLRIHALAIPPAWQDVWISPDPLGHIQATGVDSRGRTQYRYHPVWREQRDAQKFSHMLQFAGALPVLRSAAVRDLGGRELDRDRVSAAAVRLIDLGLFRIGGERYAELDHHYGATTLRKNDVKVVQEGGAWRPLHSHQVSSYIATIRPGVFPARPRPVRTSTDTPCLQLKRRRDCNSGPGARTSRD